MPSRERVRHISMSSTFLVSVGVGLTFPVSYGLVSYNYTLGSLEAQVEISAQALTTVINANPELWRFETLRIDELLMRQPKAGRGAGRRVYDQAGGVVTQLNPHQPWPTLTVSRDLLCAGEKAGRIEITRSLLPLVWHLCGLVLAGTGVALWVFRVLPLRSVLRAWEQLAKANDFLQGVMDGSTNGFAVLDADGTVRMVNNRCLELTGYSASQLIGQPFASLFRGQALERLREKLNTATGAEPAMVRFETELTARGDKAITVSCGARPLGRRDQAGSMVISLEDITERKRAEEDRHRVDKLESVGLLAGGIAHDFNNLLAGILGNVTLVKLTTNPADRSYGWLANAEKAALRAAELTRQLLTFSKGGAPVKNRINLGGLIRESAGLASTGANVRCELAIAEDLWPCEVDEGQIHQVITNLVLNATQAMPAGGTVTITAENAEIGADSIELLKQGLYLKIAVRDQGPGIPGELRSKIFDPYFTTKPKGNGLGLASCFSILKGHGGSITVDSVPGSGSTFTLFLPVHEARPQPEREAGPQVIPGTGKILVMDDEEVIRDMTSGMLQSLGYGCATAKDGAEAIALYREASAANQPFAAVIIDLTIPGGMGGQEVIGRLLEQDPQVKAIVSSGYSESDIMSDFARSGFAGVLRKPYKIEEMSRSLARILHPGDGVEDATGHS